MSNCILKHDNRHSIIDEVVVYLFCEITVTRLINVALKVVSSLKYANWLLLLAFVRRMCF